MKNVRDLIMFYDVKTDNRGIGHKDIKKAVQRKTVQPL